VDLTNWAHAKKFIKRLEKVTGKKLSWKESKAELGLYQFQRNILEGGRSSGTFGAHGRDLKIPPDSLHEIKQ